MRVIKKDQVRPKKSLGQHFLHDQHIANKIVEALKVGEEKISVLEIGPGMGVLTAFLLKIENVDLQVIEIDRDSVAYLKQHYPVLLKGNKLIEGDFMEMDMEKVLPPKVSVIGNFPYNISSQIFFKILSNRHQVDQVVCMLQKEVAERMASKEGNKTYGILSVILQAYYNIEILFKVSPGVFIPPPNVMSAVIRLERNNVERLDCNEELFVQVVKQGFNMRRKTLRNALKNLNLPSEITTQEIFNKRAEQLNVEAFVQLTKLIEQSRDGARTI
ncbi:MAG TPA: 16S rRNA (adenine(1518)-N(6)/adenine(1519)-N(6))-dimethyltransferase RsmA [Chryseolinea sp.]|nr:16S rRNA (adenine(1518)-N(6)/adenine(1519)-N(6))-dimethyltransferase RsmA [Chryseolinea sp.]